MEQGSQERQGEMLEEALKEVLERRFPYDRFEDVVKGKRGADILQVVYGGGFYTDLHRRTRTNTDRHGRDVARYGRVWTIWTL